jgi:hypothetical protein
MLSRLFFCFFFCLLISSCTVSKRLHNKGLHIQRKRTIQIPSKLSVINVDVNELKIDSNEVSIFEDLNINSDISVIGFNNHSTDLKIFSDSLIPTTDDMDVCPAHRNTNYNWETFVKSNPINDYEESSPEGKTRNMRLVYFILFSILLLFPFLFFSGLIGYFFWALISLIIGFSLFSEILFLALMIMFLTLTYFFMQYFLFKWFYKDDKFYSQDQSKFKRDFLVIASSLYLGILTIVGLVLL